MVSKLLDCAFMILLLASAKKVNSQSTSIQTCEVSNYSDTECIIRHVSEQVAQLATKIDGLQECQTPPNYQVNLETDYALTNDSLPENCKDIFDLGFTVSGVYTIYESLSTVKSSQFRTSFRRAINVYCDMEELFGGPGWIVFQRRQDSSVSFSRNWEEYADGFGHLDGNLWLGNDNLALITNGDTTYELRIELQDWDNERRYARYASFRIEDACTEYKLRLGSFTAGDAGNSLTYSNGYRFATPDNDYNGCAEQYSSGWWYESCSYSFLNNPYHNTSSPSSRGIVWRHWHGTSYALKYVEMKLRPV